MTEKRVLIVDDSEVDRMILSRAFRKVTEKQVSLREADCAAAALAALEEEEFDALFLDVNMPGHNGFHILRSAREKYPTYPPLIFMYSSSRHPDDLVQAISDGATEFLCKPNSLALVEALVAQCTTRIDEMRAA